MHRSRSSVCKTLSILGAAVASLIVVGESSPTSPSAAFQRIAMTTATTGWALTATEIYRTTNAGRRWQHTGPSLLHSSAVYWQVASSTEVWVSVVDAHTARLYYTSDGGRRWTSSQLPTPPSAFLSDITFIHPSTGFALYVVDLTPSNEKAEVFATQNRGKSWRRENNPLPLAGIKSGISVSPNRAIWLAGGSVATGHIYLYRQVNPRSPWQSVLIRVNHALKGSILWSSPPIFFNQRDGILPVFINGTGGDPIFYATHNGGLSFRPTAAVVPIGQASTASVSQWGFTTMKTGWALVTENGANGLDADAPTLYETNDGGMHWTALSTRPALSAIGLLDMLTNQVGFATPPIGPGLLKVTVKPRSPSHPAKTLATRHG